MSFNALHCLSNLLVLFLLIIPCSAQTITTYVGPSEPVDGAAALTQPIGSPSSIVADPSGGFYFVSPDLNRVYRVSAAGTLSVIAGKGTYGFSGDGGKATLAQLASPWGVTVDRTGNVYITDVGNNRVRMITPQGLITTVLSPVPGASGITSDAQGNLYVAELGGIRKIAADGSITSTFIGSLSAAGGYSISAGSAGIECPVGLAVDKFQNVFIADCKHDQILKLAPDGQVKTLPNRGIVGYEKQVIGGAIFSPPVIVSIPVYGRFSQPEGVAVDAIGRLYVADHKNHCVRRFAPDDPGRSDFNTIAGSSCWFWTVASLDGVEEGVPAPWVPLSGPSGVALDSTGSLYIADSGNNRIRKLVPDSLTLTDPMIYPDSFIVGVISTAAGDPNSGFRGDGGPAKFARLRLDSTSGIALDAVGNLYIADTGNNRIRRVGADGTVNTVAGGSQSATCSLLGAITNPATSARLCGPAGIAFDTLANLVIAEPAADRIRRLSNGGITLVAGINPGSLLGDGLSALNARLSRPLSVATDSTGSIYIADTTNNRVRKITPDGIIATVAGGGTAGSAETGPAVSAQLSSPSSIALDVSRNLYVSDTDNHRVRKVSPAGIISTVAGTGVAGSDGDGGPAILARLSRPLGLAIDTSGNLYIADSGNNRVRKVTAAGVVSTVAGNGAYGFAGDGSFAALAQLAAPSQLAVDAANNLYVLDSGNGRVRKIELTTSPRVGTFSQIASGGGWNTSITLINLSAVAITAHVAFYSDTGTPIVLPLALPTGSHVTDSDADVTIQPRGSAVIETDASTDSINVGWAEVRGSGFLSGYAIFRLRLPGMPDSEGTAQLDTTSSRSIVFAYDNTAGFQTGIALANLSATESKITAVFRDESGALLGSAQLTIPALGHSSFFVNKSFTPTENRRGTIEFQSPSGDITGVGLRFSPSLSFTSVPSAR